MTPTPAIYQRLDCHATVQGTEPEPQSWQWNQRQLPRLLCPRCGCGCAPVGWRLVAAEECLLHADQGMRIEALAHSMWSGCPNSLACQQEGTYAGDCERAQSVMPKCLKAIHSRLEYAEKRLDVLAGTAPSRPHARRAISAPTSNDPQS